MFSPFLVQGGGDGRNAEEHLGRSDLEAGARRGRITALPEGAVDAAPLPRAKLHAGVLVAFLREDVHTTIASLYDGRVAKNEGNAHGTCIGLVGRSLCFLEAGLRGGGAAVHDVGSGRRSYAGDVHGTPSDESAIRDDLDAVDDPVLVGDVERVLIPLRALGSQAAHGRQDGLGGIGLRSLVLAKQALDELPVSVEDVLVVIALERLDVVLRAQAPKRVEGVHARIDVVGSWRRLEGLQSNGDCRLMRGTVCGEGRCEGVDDRVSGGVRHHDQLMQGLRSVMSRCRVLRVAVVDAANVVVKGTIGRRNDNAGSAAQHGVVVVHTELATGPQHRVPTRDGVRTAGKLHGTIAIALLVVAGKGEVRRTNLPDLAVHREELVGVSTRGDVLAESRLAVHFFHERERHLPRSCRLGDIDDLHDSGGTEIAIGEDKTFRSRFDIDAVVAPRTQSDGLLVKLFRLDRVVPEVSSIGREVPGPENGTCHLLPPTLSRAYDAMRTHKGFL